MFHLIVSMTQLSGKLPPISGTHIANQDPNNGVSDPTIPGLPQSKSIALRAGARWQGIDLSLFAQNLANAHPVLFRSRDTAGSTLYYERSVQPRTVGVTGTFRF